MKLQTAITSLLILTSYPAVKGDDQAPPKTLTAAALQGAWQLKSDDGIIRLKFIAGGKWTITQSNPKTGVVIFHHGGSYTLEGAAYTEKVEFANSNTSSLVGTSNRFELTLQGDALHQKGLGNPWTEDWVRVKP